LLSFLDGVVEWKDDVGAVEETLNGVLIDDYLFRTAGLIVVGKEEQQARKLPVKSFKNHPAFLRNHRLF